ncbi:DNA replication/repair protein RecF [Desertihabitans brevis]|uniref:DNA replication and repair protein RecF n=1 Tax=Desertihabitans brevis TaxID=2268447 RepID=A0A367YWS7_9ACTN|nr:DNA replication/repair protein RecF [Desertihabitans brevis]RCK70353.1 DNA replication/repair protein RecF [Desertihabitans brevis]
MFVDHLTLADFRSYSHVELELAAGVTTFVGANGQGKTNLVEAVEYLSTLSSHRVASDVPLVRAGAERAVVRTRVRAGADDDRALVLELEITPGRANKARLNRSPLRSPRELVGALRTVVFSPEDLAVVKGDPAERRRFIDSLVVGRWPRLAGVKADYERVLRQRNTLLKSLSGRSRAMAEAAGTLEVWDDNLVRLGAELVHARMQSLADLAPFTAQWYADIAPTNNVATARYQTAVLPAEREPGVPARAELVEAMASELRRRRGDELQRGLTLVGPHRDDVVLSLGELPARGYASHGESWSYALSLRLGAAALLRSEDVQPVLILDDVFAELDATRRQRLAAGVGEAEQVLVTAAVVEDVPAELDGHRFRVGGGEVAAA